MATASLPLDGIDERTYKRRIWAWTMYDWGNSAFATTILAAVLPVYFSNVAGATLPSESAATALWSFGLSFSLILTAIMSPILGTISDIIRGKKRFLTFFAFVGIVATSGLVFVGTGDWMLASILAIFGRIGFSGSLAFYDALLPHVAREKDQDMVSARGFAMGYLGGGLLLVINVAMIFTLGNIPGSQLSFLSVALWWAVFTVPLLRIVPEPYAAPVERDGRQNVVTASFARLWDTLKDISKYRELLKFLVAFLIYNDAIGTIIGVATIYGAELGFGTIELILALVLVQFVGIPFSLVFGQLPNTGNKHRPKYLAFVLFNMFAMPLVGILGAQVLPTNVTGVLLPNTDTVNGYYGTGKYDTGSLTLPGWTAQTISAATLQTDSDRVYLSADTPGARADFQFNGQQVALTYSTGPDHGIWAVLVNGEPLMVEGDDDAIIPYVIDAYAPTLRYDVTDTLTVRTLDADGKLVDAPAGQYTLSLVNGDQRAPESTGSVFAVTRFEVLRPVSQASLPLIIGAMFGVQLVGIAFAFLLGHTLFSKLAEAIDTRRAILIALTIYSFIAIWGFILGSTIEYWFLAWMVAIVQGGSQALSRSLFTAMSPASKSGEFFGLFGVMERFASFIGPLLFALAATAFGTSRPAILSLIAFFIIGGFLLTRVNVDEGKRVAQEEDRAAMGGAGTAKP